MTRLDYCFDQYVDGDEFDPRTLPEPVDLETATHNELAVAWRKNWQPGQELRITFLDGDADLRARVKAVAEQWLDYANLTFKFGNHAEPEMRISFKGRGYWSYVGTDSANIPQDQPTLQLGGFTVDMDDEEFRRPVLHEFGHAIGCIHEQASPAARIPWDEEKVYAFYQKWQGWDRQKTFANVLRRYSAADVRFTRHDKASIMQYPVPEELTKGNYSIGWNTGLSDQDKSFIARMYPAR